ncbi:MAG: hypothetical protein MJY63_04865 [Paludibacteraceae bacterium]|nr:hypothetical protein [Paludibacteraceae bacterium]
MTDLNIKLDKLFEEWKERNADKALSNIINRKEVYEKVAFTSDGVLKLPNNKHFEWTKPEYKRVLFLLKDQYQNANDENARWDESICNWLIWDDEKNPKKGERNLNLEQIKKGGKNIFRPLGRWLLGVQSILEEDKCISFKEVTDDKVKDCIKNNPMAIMECKKQPGGPNLNPAVLKKYLERDKDLIKEEIELLNPDVIICCDKSGIIYNNIVSILGENYNYKTVAKVMHHTFVINSYHPSYSYRSSSASERCYHYVVNALRAAILCEKVISHTTSDNNKIKPTIDWNVWGNAQVYGINIQYLILPQTRIGIEALYVNSNTLHIYLRLWWNVDEQIITEIFGESHKWNDITVTINASDGTGIALLEKVVGCNSDDVSQKVAVWHEKLTQWMNK